jgi:hypothetical protein
LEIQDGLAQSAFGTFLVVFGRQPTSREVTPLCKPQLRTKLDQEALAGRTELPSVDAAELNLQRGSAVI